MDYFGNRNQQKILLTSRTLSKQTLNLHAKYHQNILFSLTLKFLKDHDSFKVKYLMFKHILSQQKYSNTRISALATLSVLRRALLKGEALRLLRTNSVKESLRYREFLTRDIERGYPQELVQAILAEVRFKSRKTALQKKPKTSKKILPFVTTFSPVTTNLKKRF